MIGTYKWNRVVYTKKPIQSDPGHAAYEKHRMTRRAWLASVARCLRAWHSVQTSGRGLHSELELYLYSYDQK